ncbi:MAG: sodium-translocating pyrophosphatase [Verrucomicrobia bacterium]|nr:sodium-translocating pyrophosphatase [Verrucomicrobiota bacterium]
MMNFLVQYALESSLAAAGLGLLAAFGLIAWIRKQSDGNDRMREVAAAIQEGAAAYLNRQLQAISLIAIILFAAIVWLKNLPTGLGFLTGAACSLAAGFFGMRIAVMANVRTAEAASKGRTAALRAAFNGGAVTGLLVVALALLSIGVFYMIALKWVGLRAAIDSLTGLALGSSLVSVFARLGGGIYTKAADVGADLVGKIESKLEEDDPRNPATIADNVGDNVGDCAGMAADVFETYAVSLIGCVLVAFLTVIGANGQPNPNALVYPFMLGGVSILSAILGILTVNYGKGNPTRLISCGVLVSALVSAAALWPLTHAFFPNGLPIDGRICSANGIYFASLVGLLMTFVVLLITNYYTSTHYRPVQHIAKASETGHATNIIAGLAIGSHATALPVGFIGIAILLSYHFAGLFGIAIAVMAMLSMAGIVISLDAFGPITDNAGGIAVMSGLPKQVRERTDELDAVGNTMKAVTKGYAIASAGLASLVLFGTYVQELKAHFLAIGTAMPSLEFSLVEPKVIIGLFIGGLLPFVFTARSMDAVGVAAGAVVREVRRQIAAKPGILKHKDKPDYGKCVDIVTQAALRQMIVPALLPVLFVVGVAAIPGLGPVVLGGVLVGTIVTGLFVAIAMTSSGGAWDNAKKFIEEGNFGGKGSPAHAAAVTGDTVGDPYKDTAGPAINPMIKVVNIVAILVIPIFF